RFHVTGVQTCALPILLTPEESESKNIGFVWSPGFVEGLSMNVDWWTIKIENTIVGDTPTQMLNDCYVENIAARCGSFTRDPISRSEERRVGEGGRSRV